MWAALRRADRPPRLLLRPLGPETMQPRAPCSLFALGQMTLEGRPGELGTRTTFAISAISASWRALGRDVRLALTVPAQPTFLFSGLH